MNKCMLVGRLTKDPEIREISGNTPKKVARFTVAVNRRFKNKDGNYDADFIGCICYGATAEFIEKYFGKGMAIGISGRIQTGHFTNKEGVEVYTTDVVVEEAEFVESKGNSAKNETAPTENQGGFDNYGSDDDEDLPF